MDWVTYSESTHHFNLCASTKEETAVNPDTLKGKLKFKRNLSEQEEISKNWVLKFVDEKYQ